LTIYEDRQERQHTFLPSACRDVKEIRDGKFPPGGRLPTEAELVSRSKLSRITVRKGIEVLENEGWVVRKQGLGTFVQTAINQNLTDVKTITEVLLEQCSNPRVKVIKFSTIIPPEHVQKVFRLKKDEKILQIATENRV
jgi:GntR family transcriptional regulator